MSKTEIFPKNMALGIPEPLTPMNWDFQDKKRNPAKWAYERLVESIKDFEEGLDDEHEVGARLASFGSQITIHIEDLGYWGPDIIKFYGRDDVSNDVELIQHISQLNVLLIALPKEGVKPKRIGYILEQKNQEGG